MDEMDEAVDLVLLYEVTSLPPETTEQVEVLQRCAELTAEAMARLGAAWRALHAGELPSATRMASTAVV